MSYEGPSNAKPASSLDDEALDALPWWRQYITVLIIGVIFVPACIAYTWVYFPEIGLAKSVVTGLCFGLFCTMCAASGRVFW